MKYIVAMDGSEHAKRALARALKLFNEDKDEILLLHVVYIMETSALDPLHDRIELINNYELRETAKKLEEEHAELCKKDNISWLTVEGEPRQVLVEHSHKADMLIMGSRGLGLLKRLLLGSVSDHCVHHAACPVLVVRESEDE